MRGERLRKRMISSRPTRVVPRRSTDAMAISDKRIVRALEFIWREAGNREAIHVSDVVRQIGSSRRFAEIRFKTVVGRTILEEIQRVRLERAKRLLIETELPRAFLTVHMRLG